MFTSVLGGRKVVGGWREAFVVERHAHLGWWIGIYGEGEDADRVILRTEVQKLKQCGM